MKTIIISIILVIAIFKIQAQNYLIGFAGAGASTGVDSVKVENLSQCTSISMAGTDILALSQTVGLEVPDNPHESYMEICPNPSAGDFTVEFEAVSRNSLYISLFDVSGKMVLQQKEYLPSGHHTFRLEGIHRGVYFLKVDADNYQYSTKLISNSEGTGSPVIVRAGSSSITIKQTMHSRTKKTDGSLDATTLVGMQFNAGDTLKLTGESGNYRTVNMLFPTHSQTVTFNFVKCTDADSNHYSVVQLGSQLWMQENLKATKYRDGSDIPNVTDSAAWSILSTGAYCDYHNLPAEGAYYGHLYNYYAVDDSRNMCPIGWHVPSHSEWNIMEKFLDPTVDTTALAGTGKMIGRILKEGCDTRWQYYDSTYGFNSAGFAALCSNYRVTSGAWSLAPNDNHDTGFWTSTSYNANSAWYRSLRWCTCDIYVLFPFKRSGNSVRCIKD
jgi:uncharacterized protein (TIGR02145 family)